MIKGLCGKETAGKQEDFRAIMSHHIRICNGIFKKNGFGFPYIYIDLFGGPGYFDDKDYTGPGSPVIVQKLLQDNLNFPYKRFIYEADFKRYNQLIRHIGKDDVYPNSCASLLNRLLPIKRKWQYGLLYCDPDMTEENFWLSSKIMKEVSTKYETIDLMFYVSCTAIKRMRARWEKEISLKKLIKPVKKKWIIRELSPGQQYTFLIGTNWTGWAQWQTRGFHSIDSLQGQAILNKADGDVKKKKMIQSSFLTGLMQNTSNIPNIELSECKRLNALRVIVNFARNVLLRKFII